MQLHRGMRVRELSKRVGIPSRRGTVRSVKGSSIEVEWDDGHRSSVTGGYLFPEPAKRR